ncbi:hypothetical protein TWF696_005289 [Orbilia brochopaga]|uniref:Uncharacterized protein n=1 Tax=Orbilia brochopaga TaxID=3140254 RepID=A0AAV9V3L9_9PEZI
MSFGRSFQPAWDPAASVPSLAPRHDPASSTSFVRPYRKFAKPVSRSDACFSRPPPPQHAASSSSSAASYISAFTDSSAAAAKRRKRGPAELNDDLADDNFIPSIKSAINGGTMPSAGLKAGLKRELDSDSDSDCDDADYSNLRGGYYPSDDSGSGMKNSYLSDTQYRRTCGTATHESDNRGGKRRLLNVVGSVVGSIWEFCTSQMQNSLAGIIPKLGWSTAAAEYYDTPFNAPPGLFDEDVDNISLSTYSTSSFASAAPEFAFAKPTIPTAAAVPPPSFLSKKPTLKSIIPPSPVREEEEDPFSARTADYSLLDEDMTRSRMGGGGNGGTDSPMSASWILVKPEPGSSSRGSSPAPRSPSASAASMRRLGSNYSQTSSSSLGGSPVFATPPGGAGRRTVYSRAVPSRKMRGVAARPAGYSGGTRSTYLSRSATAPSSSSSFGSTGGIGLGISSAGASMQSTFTTGGASTFSSNFSSQSSFGRSNGGVASSVTSIGSSMPSSPARGGASAAGSRLRGATVSGLPAASTKKRVDDDDELAQMDVFSKQLRALIREGKEALGSKIEVYECDDDWM